MGRETGGGIVAQLEYWRAGVESEGEEMREGRGAIFSLKWKRRRREESDTGRVESSRGERERM